MANCVGITIGSDYDCVNPLKASVAERLLVGNLADIEVVTYSVTPGEENVIEDITMKSGTAMYAFEGVRSSNVPDINGAFDDFSVGFTHQMAFSVFEVDSLQKTNLQAMASKKQFCIYQNPKDSSLGNSVWEVMGVNSGLDMTALQRLPASKDGSYKVTLLTPAAASETGLPNSFFKTDIVTTEALIDALLTPVP